MAIRSSDQISIVDVTDAYSVTLTSDSHTFIGSTAAAKAGTTTTQVIAMLGAQQKNASVVMSEIVKPDGVTVSSDNNATSPTLTIGVTTAVTTGGVIRIPVHIDDVTITKEFSFAIAFTGESGTSVSVNSTSVTYQKGTSGTVKPTGTWTNDVPSVGEGEFLWTKTVVEYTDGKSTEAYSVSRSGTSGSSVSVNNTSVTYQKGASGTTQPTGTWSSAVPSVGEGEFLWTKTVVEYTDGKSTTSYSVSYSGKNGNDGADAITLTITSSNGTIFKNSAISTVLTAHVYKAGAEVTGSALTALGTIKWYKDGGTTAVATGQTLTIDAGDVTNKATYVAQLEE